MERERERERVSALPNAAEWPLERVHSAPEGVAGRPPLPGVLGRPAVRLPPTAAPLCPGAEAAVQVMLPGSIPLLIVTGPHCCYGLEGWSQPAHWFPWLSPTLIAVRS
jgi:hypothetical protein